MTEQEWTAQMCRTATGEESAQARSRTLLDELGAHLVARSSRPGVVTSARTWSRARLRAGVWPFLDVIP
jgi:hypothetical protein